MLGVFSLDRSLLFAALAALLAASAMAQTCDTLLGGTNCGAPGQGRTVPLTPEQLGAGSRSSASDQPFTGRFNNQPLGLDLSVGGDDPGYFGGITIGGGGVKCSGLFRSRDCFK